MDDVKEKTFAHLSTHILIRDKNTKAILLNKNVKQSLRNQNKNIKDMEKQT